MMLDPLLLVARVFMTGLFVLHVVNALKLPAADGLLYAAIAIQILGVVTVALGYKTRFAALLLASFSALSLLLVHGRPEGGWIFITDLRKGLAVIGAFVFLFAYGPGTLSLDARKEPTRPSGQEGVLASIARHDAVMGPLLLVGRLLPLVIFFTAGTNKILHTAVMQEYMVNHNAHVPTILIYPAIVVQIIPPTLVVLGYKTRYAALALAGFCVIAPALFHSDFGNPSEVEQFFLDFVNAGGFLFMFANGPGALSLDRRQLAVDGQTLTVAYSAPKGR
jgi:putative oxidoreductase